MEISLKRTRSVYQTQTMTLLLVFGDCPELEEMDPPTTLQCELRPYQKQALHWMVSLEKGDCLDEAATTLHPCWGTVEERMEGVQAREQRMISGALTDQEVRTARIEELMMLFT
ncbi:DNA repair protein RAD5A-like protein [Drosera capensis]